MDPAERSPEQQARFALAHMMEFHRREDKAGWWEYFRLLGLEERELAEERRALTGLVFEAVLEAKKAPLQRYCICRRRRSMRARATRCTTRSATKIGTVADVSLAARTIDIKKTKATADEHPTAVFFHNQVSSAALRKSLMRLGEAVLANGFSGGRSVARRHRPACCVARPRPAMRAAACSGPARRPCRPPAASRSRSTATCSRSRVRPGTGKTYTGAHVICALVRAGLKVGVTAVSHKVIVNLLEGAAKQAREEGRSISIVHREEGVYAGQHGIERRHDYDDIRAGLADGTIQVLGATAWCWARPDFEQSVDVLIVDEAGQMSLANVLATAPAARSLVLLGDPQQLEQPLQSSHPEGSEVSALYHVLDGEDTMPADKGLFLAETYRLHPDIAKFTSEVYYEGKVEARPGLERQAIISRDGSASPLAGSGLMHVPVAHTGNRARSPEEVAVIGELVAHLTSRCDWRDKDGVVRPVRAEDILIVAPYNAQVAALVEALPALADRIGTVDRFQGQEAPVVVYSMTSSSPEDAPRGMEFLYNRFRFNVATSRAKCALHPRRQSRAVSTGMQDSAADEDGEWVLPVPGAGENCREPDEARLRRSCAISQDTGIRFSGSTNGIGTTFAVRVPHSVSTVRVVPGRARVVGTQQ